MIFADNDKQYNIVSGGNFYGEYLAKVLDHLVISDYDTGINSVM